MNVPRDLVEAMLNEDATKPHGLRQIAAHLIRWGEGGMASRLLDFASKLEVLSQEEVEA